VTSELAVMVCTRCGRVRVRLRDVVLRNRLDDDSWAYRARCPYCAVIVLEPTHRKTAMAAMAAGAAVEYWTLPPSAREGGDGPPITVGDLVVLRYDLEQRDVIARLRAAMRSQ
jgi:hypothetical protein